MQPVVLRAGTDEHQDAASMASERDREAASTPPPEHAAADPADRPPVERRDDRPADPPDSSRPAPADNSRADNSPADNASDESLLGFADAEPEPAAPPPRRRVEAADEEIEEGDEYLLLPGEVPAPSPLRAAMQDDLRRAEQQIEEEERPPHRQPLQFTLLELFGLTTGLAVFLSLVMLLPGGDAAERVAAVMGLVLLLSMIAIESVSDVRPIVRVGWWIALGVYLAVCLAALLRHL